MPLGAPAGGWTGAGGLPGTGGDYPFHRWIGGEIGWPMTLLLPGRA